MYKRFITDLLLESLKDSPVVLLSGARQTGKTTLVRQIVGDAHPAQYISLDDAGFLSAATGDPAGFLAGVSGPIVLDEVQRAPGLFPAIKASVDSDRSPGRFLLTGSANVLLLPKLSESLAGRMDILTLWPLAQAEIEGSSDNIVDLLFSDKLDSADIAPITRTDLIKRVVAGGYPEPLGRSTDARRRAWYGSYVTAILQRDVRDMANIDGLTEMPRLLQLLVARTASLLNTAEISRSAGIPYTTLHRYLSLLQATFLVRLLPAWSANLGLRFVRAPKLLLNDTGLATSLIGLDAVRLHSDTTLFGHILENFVATEIIKSAEVSATQSTAYHFRTAAGAEVDMVLEAPNGRLIGIEVKASATVASNDFRGLRALADAVGDRFWRGTVIYTGDHIIPFGERLHALPIQALWS